MNARHTHEKILNFAITAINLKKNINSFENVGALYKRVHSLAAIGKIAFRKFRCGLYRIWKNL